MNHVHSCLHEVSALCQKRLGPTSPDEWHNFSHSKTQASLSITLPFLIPLLPSSKSTSCTASLVSLASPTSAPSPHPHLAAQKSPSWVLAVSVPTFLDLTGSQPCYILSIPFPVNAAGIISIYAFWMQVELASLCPSFSSLSPSCLH